MLNLILDKRNEKDPIIYPYFFLNPERVGITGMITWILALLAGFIVMGYIIMIIDHLLGKMLIKPASGFSFFACSASV